MTLPQPSTIAGRVASLLDAELVNEPGTAFHYFNPNYAVLARIVEVVAGQPFPEYLRDLVFAPLGMARTTSVVTSTETGSVAPHLAQGHILAFGVPIAREEPDAYLGGAGGVISTARDMADWLILQNEGGVFHGGSLLSGRGIDLMQTPPAGIDSSYAMAGRERQEPPRSSSTRGRCRRSTRNRRSCQKTASGSRSWRTFTAVSSTSRD